MKHFDCKIQVLLILFQGESSYFGDGDDVLWFQPCLFGILQYVDY